MRIGVITSWLPKRYLPFWEPYLRELGQELVYPQNPSSQVPLPQPAQLTLAQAIDLKGQGIDVLLLPDTQLGHETSNTEGVSPWLSDLAAALNRLVPGLPTTLAVPAELHPDTAGLAAEIGQALTRNPMLTRRALQSSKILLSQGWPKPPNPSGGLMLGLVGQPYLLESPLVQQPLAQAAQSLGMQLCWPELPPAKLREQGLLVAKLDLPSDQEVMGQTRSLHNMGKIQGLLLLHHPEIAPLPAAVRRYLSKSTKPWAIHTLEQDPHPTLMELAQALS